MGKNTACMFICCQQVLEQDMKSQFLEDTRHYQNQINQLNDDEKELKSKIEKFREDELHHKDIAYEEGATKKGFYSIMDKVIKTGSKIAIGISEKI